MVLDGHELEDDIACRSKTRICDVPWAACPMFAPRSYEWFPSKQQLPIVAISSVTCVDVKVGESLSRRALRSELGTEVQMHNSASVLFGGGYTWPVIFRAPFGAS